MFNVNVVLIISNGILTIGINANPASPLANNIAIGYLLYRRIFLNQFHFVFSLLLCFNLSSNSVSFKNKVSAWSFNIY